MLQHLRIKNYALIQNLDINLEPGLTVITGETGAGKSILLGALGLILGERADSKVLFNTRTKCIVEGHFDIREYQMKNFFDSRNLDYDEHTIIRREISESGKSRAFINDTPVGLNDLKELGNLLVDIHSQHETLKLNSTTFQLDVVDNFAGLVTEKINYAKEYLLYKQTQSKLNKLIEQEEKAKADFDYFKFQWNELDEAHLDAAEYEAAQQDLVLLSNAEEIKLVTSNVSGILGDGENNLIDQLQEVKYALSGIQKFHPNLPELINRFQSIIVDLKDINEELLKISDNTTADASRMELLNVRINQVFNLLKKYRLTDVNDLILLKEKFEQELLRVSTLESEISSLGKSLEHYERNLRNLAEGLSESRRNAIPLLQRELQGMLQDVGLVNAEIKIEQQIIDWHQSGEYGSDKITFLFCSNKGGTFQPISKVASGGELSRLMLCIKSILAKSSAMPTLIFDEIDTGVSGEIAHKVGTILRQLSSRHQVFAITHLPQLAGKGQQHLFVFKKVEGEITETHIRYLNKEERVAEIASMLSGAKPTQAAIANAKELIYG